MNKKKTILIIVAVILLIPAIVFFGFPQVILNMSVNKARKAAGLTAKTVVVDEFTVEYLEGGSGEPVIMLHGLGGDKDNWAAFAKTITPSYRVIALDLPGSGESTKNLAALYGIALQSERLGKIASALGAAKFHLVGNGMGSVIASHFAISKPDKVLSLTLINTEAVPCPERSEFEKQVAVGKNPLSVTNVADFDNLLKFMFVTPPSIPGPIKRYLTKKSIANSDFNQKIFWDVFGEDYKLAGELGKIKSRTLVMWGEKDNRVHVSCTKLLEKGIAKSAVVIIKDCGHFPMREKPDDAAKEFLKFVKG
ncbi:MAG TPA: alpha/beta hydrolase [Spirochaetota bacterium]|nr:alpha/beta hydrolase [Spirochaetota bacterium]HNT10486.1 alpha/beta hydrolase [Spirochaetota bacterium]